MAKRVRGSTSRPGRRARPHHGATQSTAKSVAPTTQATARPDELTDAEEARAAVLEAAIVAEERQAEASKARAKAARSTDPVTARPGTNLAASAAEEYAYVARDVRRITILGGGLILFLLGLWAVATVTGFSLF